MKNQQTTCPQCGAKGKAGMFCEYCGTKIPMPKTEKEEKKVNDDESEKSEYIILATSDAQEIKDKVIEALVKADYVPLDVFGKMKMGEPSLMYYPMYLISVSYNISWNCTQVIEVWKERVVYKDGQPKKENYREDEYHPANGEAHGHTTFLIGADDNIGRKFDYIYDSNFIPLSDELAIVCGIKDRTYIDRQEALSASEDHILQDMKSTLHRQLPSHYIDLRCSKSNNNNVEAKLIFVPYWSVKYEYEGKDYSFQMRGDCSKVDVVSMPKDEGQKQQYRDVKALKLDGQASSYFFAYLCCLVVVCLLICAVSSINVDFWVFLTVFGGLGCSFTAGINSLVNDYNKKIDSYNKHIKNSAAEQRQVEAHKHWNYKMSANSKTESVKCPVKPSFTLYWLTLLLPILFGIGYIMIEKAEENRQEQAWERSLYNLEP